MRSLLLIVLFVACTRAPVSQATSSTPADGFGAYALGIARRWGRGSPLGDLAVRAAEGKDVEVRFWCGYSFGGTRGTILRRTRGHGEAWRAAVVTCALDLPIPVGDTLSAPSMARYRAEAVRRCAEPYPRPGGGYGALVIKADTVGVTPLDLCGSPATLWNEVVRAGVATLPPSVPRTGIINDGFIYVVELRRGAEYRASVIEEMVPPETPADRTVQAVFAILKRYDAAPRSGRTRPRDTSCMPSDGFADSVICPPRSSTSAT